MRVSVALPRRANLLDLFVSPYSDRLGWHLAFQRSRLSRPRFSSQFPFVEFEKVFIDALWVSTIDGSQMREVGHVKPPSIISTAGWTPDGQHFDFGYFAGEPIQTLWTVPVD